MNNNQQPQNQNYPSSSSSKLSSDAINLNTTHPIQGSSSSHQNHTNNNNSNSNNLTLNSNNQNFNTFRNTIFRSNNNSIINRPSSIQFRTNQPPPSSSSSSSNNIPHQSKTFTNNNRTTSCSSSSLPPSPSKSPSRMVLEDPFNPPAQKPSRPRSTTGRNSSALTKKRQYGDRFIPNRGDGLDLSTTFQLMDDAQPNTGDGSGGSKKAVVAAVSDLEKDEARRMFTNLLRAETFGSEQSETLNLLNQSPSHSRNPSTVPNSSPSTPRKSNPANQAPNTAGPSSKLFNFSSPSRRDRNNSNSLDSPTHHRYSTSPIKYESQRMLLSPRKPSRALSKVPFKVLDAPDLADDYYLNLVDWSSTNVLGVGLGSQVYLWSATTSAVTRLVDVAQPVGSDHVTSLSWIGRGNILAIGTDTGKVHIWDTQAGKRVRTMEGHESRIGCMDWNEYILSTGSRDRTIVHRDVRVAEHWVSRLSAHKQEVCGLRWNPSTNQLASGGNDNRLLIWEGRAANSGPIWRFNEHTAAIKALSWSPHQNGLLASGGGSADKKIRFWNTLNGNLLNQIDTGSQVCSLKWSKNSNEIVSTHGFSPGPIQNQVCLWKYPSMQQIATLSGHTYRVLYLAMSPDGETIVTGAGDETLRFWHAFPKKPNSASMGSSLTTSSLSTINGGSFGIGGLGKFGGGGGSAGGSGHNSHSSVGGIGGSTGLGSGSGGGMLNLFAQMR